MKFYDHGKPIRRSTGKYEKSDAKKALLKAEMQVLEGQQEGGRVHRTKFQELEEDIKREYARKERRSWSRRENSLSHLRPFFGGMLVKGITTEKVDRYVDKRISEGAAPATINRELDTLRHMMRLGTRVTRRR